MATLISRISPTIGQQKQLIRRSKWQQQAGRLLLYAALLIGGFFWVYPFLWALGSSFKSATGFFNEGLNIIPKEFQFSNYAQAWTEATFGAYFLNTVFITRS